LTYDNIVKGYRKTIYHVSAETENMSLEKSLEDIKAIITNISAHVGFTPEYEELDKYYSIYSWSKDSKIIKLYIDSYVTKNGYFYKRVVKEITIK